MEKSPGALIASGIGGGVLLIVGLLLQAHYGPINSACKSAAGTFSQALSPAANNDCGTASDVIVLAYILIGLGALSVLGALFNGFAISKRTKSGKGWQTPAGRPR